MKKKVFFIMSTDDYSGAENVNFSIINGLKDQFDFYWVSRKGKINSFLESENINWIEIESLSVKEIRRVVKEYKPDILHATDFTASCICSLSMVKTPIISHLHHNAPWLKKINLKTLLYLICSFRLKKILTVSDSIEKEYIFANFIKNKIECIGNPISVDKIRNKVSNKDYNKKYDICFVGRLTEAKNPLRWLDIIYEIKKEIPNIKCVWVGDGELKQEFIEKMEKLKLQKNIEMPGFQKNPYTFLAASKIFLQTSTWEGFGLSAFEALALGVPAVVSNVGGLPLIVDNECGGLCNKNEEFTKKILFLLKNSSDLNKFSKCAIEHAKNIDNLKQYTQKLQEEYK